mgnify:FL=1
MFLFCVYRLKAAKIKGCSDLKDWVDPIVNHFWFCCHNAEGSEERIKVTLHHGES